MNKRNLSKIASKIGYTFRDVGLLERALTHRSVSYLNNERLEFLGDSILGYVIARKLYEQFPQANESDLTLMRVDLVRGKTLAHVARKLSLGSFLVLGSGERKSGGHDRDSILADALEALIGAIVCDSGINAAELVVSKLFEDQFDGVSLPPQKDPKTQLQELLQSQGQPPPNYEIADFSGEDHARTYRVSCVANGYNPTKGSGNSRKNAEKAAASLMIKQIERQK